MLYRFTFFNLVLKCSHYITLYAMSVMEFSFLRLSTKIF